MKQRQRVLSLTGIAILAAAVFVVDMLTPSGIEVWVFYLPVILFLVLLNDRRLVIVGGAVSSVLVVICYFISSPGANPHWWDLLNRGYGIIAIWFSVVRGVMVCNRTAQLESALADLNQETDRHRQTSQVLRVSEERLRLAMKGGGMGTRDADVRMATEVWSETYFWILGYEPTPDGAATRDMWLSRVHPNDRMRVLREEEQARQEHALYHVEYRILQPLSQEIVWIEALGLFYYDDHGEAVRYIGVCFDISRRKTLENELLEITARRQQEFGQELHDGVGQALTGLGLMAQTLTQRLPADSAEQPIAVRLVEGLDRVHKEIRDLSRGLIPVHVDARGLAAALHDLAARTSEQSGVSVTSECPDWVEIPDHATATHMFRIAQEAVANALRHGRARQIRLTLLYEPNELRLRIKDDGIGIQSRPEKRDGLGLRIMKYRAGLVGGGLQISSSERGGTIVTLTLPWSERNGEKEFRCVAARGEDPDRG